MITLDSVSKTIRGRQVLQETTLSIPEGRTTALIGPSGCGKTTLLRIVLGLVIPDAGQVRIGDKRLEQANALNWRHQIGYVIQHGGLFPHLSARRNVTLLAEHLHVDGPTISRRVEELSALVRLTPEMLDRPPGALSGGQRQRVALMRALMLDPPLLLLDEPLGALDPMIRFDLQNDLAAIFAQLGKTVVIVTHDMHEAAHFAHEIVLMREGRVLQQGVLEDFLERPTEDFVTDFLRAQRADPRLAAV